MKRDNRLIKYYDRTLLIITASLIVAISSHLAVYRYLLSGSAWSPDRLYFAGFILSVLFSLILVGVSRMFYLDVRREIAEQARLHAAHYQRIREAYLGALDTLGEALDSRDRETQGHSIRVVLLSLALADAIGLPPKQKQVLAWGALLHDLGKIGIPDSILHKPGPLSPEERKIMQRHVEIGYRMVRRSRLFSPCAQVVLHHHEHWDGTGYPFGLRGEQIPVEARIFAVADALDAMTSRRPYREPVPLAVAYEEILRRNGTQFCPRCVEALKSLGLERIGKLIATANEAAHQEGWLDKLVGDLLFPVYPDEAGAGNDETKATGHTRRDGPPWEKGAAAPTAKASSPDAP